MKINEAVELMKNDRNCECLRWGTRYRVNDNILEWFSEDYRCWKESANDLSLLTADFEVRKSTYQRTHRILMKHFNKVCALAGVDTNMDMETALILMYKGNVLMSSANLFLYRIKDGVLEYSNNEDGWQNSSTPTELLNSKWKRANREFDLSNHMEVRGGKKYNEYYIKEFIDLLKAKIKDNSFENTKSLTLVNADVILDEIDRLSGDRFK